MMKKASLEGHTVMVNSLAFSPDGKFLGSGGNKGELKLWDVAGEKLAADLKGHLAILSGVAFSPDSKTLASAGADGKVKLWDVTSGKPRRTLIFDEASRLYCIQFSPDGKSLAGGGTKREVFLWDVTRGEVSQRLKQAPFPVRALTFSPDGARLATVSDRSVYLWPLGEK
jgi:WD40 repeat protein